MLTFSVIFTLLTLSFFSINRYELKEAIMKSVDLLQKSSFDEIRATIDDALKLGNDNDFGYDYKIDFEKRFEIKNRNPISTGWQLIDDLCRGGLARANSASSSQTTLESSRLL